MPTASPCAFTVTQIALRANGSCDKIENKRTHYTFLRGNLVYASKLPRILIPKFRTVGKTRCVIFEAVAMGKLSTELHTSVRASNKTSLTLLNLVEMEQ